MFIKNHPIGPILLRNTAFSAQKTINGFSSGTRDCAINHSHSFPNSTYQPFLEAVCCSLAASGIFSSQNCSTSNLTQQRQFTHFNQATKQTTTTNRGYQLPVHRTSASLEHDLGLLVPQSLPASLLVARTVFVSAVSCMPSPNV